MGITFTLARSTQEALATLSKQRFAAIISDMGRKEGPSEGYVLLDAVRTT
jgi:CheY-like chemotaxis protein